MKWVLAVEPAQPEKEYLERIVGRMGYGFFSVENGELGIRSLKSSIPNVLLCADTLPDMDLGDFCATVRQDPKLASLPMLLLTSHAQVQAKITAAQYGFADAVVRPIAVRTFYHQLEGCLSGHRRQYLRAPIVFPVRIIEEGRTRDLQTTAFGEGGMYIRTEDPGTAGRDIKVSFELPRVKRAFNLGARVLYSMRKPTDDLPAGMGVRFLDLTEVLRMIFGIFLVNHLARATPAA